MTRVLMEIASQLTTNEKVLSVARTGRRWGRHGVLVVTDHRLILCSKRRPRRPKSFHYATINQVRSVNGKPDQIHVEFFHFNKKSGFVGLVVLNAERHLKIIKTALAAWWAESWRMEQKMMSEYLRQAEENNL